ncbi:MAG: translation elongation factor-like protein [bacterium]|nr:translation elongation factor-like protein [bacterium]
MPTKKKKAAPKVKARPKKKAAAKKVSVKKVKKAAPKAKKSKDKLLGKVDHYFDKINVAAMKLGDSLKVGDTVRIEGGSVAFTQQITSMQIEHESVSTAKKGDEVGFKVKQKVREGYRVFRV